VTEIQEATKQALLKFQKSPELFFERVLGVTTLEDYDRRVLQSVVDNERTAIAACHDVGKTWKAARVVLWFASCFPYSKVITTAPTYNQVKNILWSEIRAAHSRALIPLGGKLNLTDWQLSQEGDWFAIGFTPRNELSGEAGQGTQSSFQGFHAPHLLLVFDEATGIPTPTWNMAEGLLTSANVKFLAIGNPTSRSSEFFKCFSSPSWAKIYLSCFDSPNLRANGIVDEATLMREIQRVREMPEAEAQARLKSYEVVKPYMLSTKWVIQSILRWGIEHPLTVSKVLGKFPRTGTNVLIPLDTVEEAQRRVHNAEPGERKTIGVDVARFGVDTTVFTAMHGLQAKAKKSLVKRDTGEVSGEVIAFYREHGADVIVVDETGVGGGVVDNLREAQRNKLIPENVEIRGVQFGAGVECSGGETCKHDSADCDKARYVNLKARMFGLLADDLKAGLALLPDEVYAEELPTILYGYDSKGKLVIESKDDYKKRTGRSSPDHADSLALANYGRYDETTVGVFSKEHTNFPPPFAASLGAQRQW
jgi:phage terminase large subunit